MMYLIILLEVLFSKAKDKHNSLQHNLTTKYFIIIMIWIRIKIKLYKILNYQNKFWNK